MPPTPTRGVDNGPAPSKTSMLYRVSYRRADRPRNRGYTYKVFKSEGSARAFMERLQRVPDEKTPEAYRELAPLAELYLHWAAVRWETVDPEDSANFVPASRAPTEAELLAEAKRRRPGVTNMDVLLDEVQLLVNEEWKVLA